MKTLGYISIFVAGIVICYLSISMGVVGKIHITPDAQQEPTLNLPTYLSFLSVMMTAVTAVLAALAIGIGIIAAYTFRELKNEAHATSENTAKQVAIDALSEVKVKAMVFELYAKAEKEREQVKEWGGEPAENEER